jgi:hypothetical protein
MLTLRSSWLSAASAFSARVLLQPASLLRVLTAARALHVAPVAVSQPLATAGSARGFASAAGGAPKKAASTGAASTKKRTTKAKKTTSGGAKKKAPSKRKSSGKRKAARKPSSGKTPAERLAERSAARQARKDKQKAERAASRQRRAERRESSREKEAQLRRDARQRKDMVRDARRGKFEKEVKARHEKAVEQFYKHRTRQDGAPRPPVTPYAAFTKQQYADKKVQRAAGDPKASIGEAARSIAKAWAELNPETKAKLQADYAMQREAYEAEQRKFEKTQPPKRPMLFYAVSREASASRELDRTCLARVLTRVLLLFLSVSSPTTAVALPAPIRA